MTKNNLKMKYVDEVHITSDNGIIKKMHFAGAGDCPEKGQEVTVNYEGRLEDGTVFDRSVDHGEPLKFHVGTGMVIEGWDKGIMAMKLGEKADLIIKSKYGYGDMGSPPKIPGGATLHFTVELIQIADRRPTR